MIKPFEHKLQQKSIPHQPTALPPGSAKMMIYITYISGTPTYLPVIIVPATDIILPPAPLNQLNAYMPHPQLPPAPLSHPIAVNMGFGISPRKTINIPTPQMTHPIVQPPPHHTAQMAPQMAPVPVSTVAHTVRNHRACSSINVTDAIAPITMVPNASSTLLHHSDLSPSNPLPSTVNTPVNVYNFSRALVNYPDTELKTYLLNGLTHGFSIGFNNTCHVPTQPNNLLSATQHSEEVTKALQKELQRGHTSGPFLHPPWKDLHCSPLGSREKKDGSRRLIMDLSQPQGSSINDNIDKGDFPCQYTHFDNATNMVYNQGRNCLMTKIDIQHAFRLLPVNPAQWILLGICWLGMYFVDTRLPFGLRSAPAIFNRFADAVCWILNFVYNFKNLIHYSDDFFLVSSSNPSHAASDLSNIKSVFHHLSIPIAEDKLEGPSTSITYLGINSDSTNFTIRITDDKYIELSTLLSTWRKRKKCTKRDLLSLIGKLSFACKVVRPGRIFMRRLITLSTTVHQLQHHITLNRQAQADIQWWIDFLPSWNRSSLIPESFTILSSDLQLFTDASNIGFGAFYNRSWIQAAWPDSYLPHSIDYKELFAILAACITWGSHWKGKRIVFITDNLPITEIWKKGSSPSDPIMSLTRKLYMIAAKCQFSVSLKHILGIHNSIADSLSRFQMTRFQAEAPHADVTPTPLPQNIWD